MEDLDLEAVRRRADAAAAEERSKRQEEEDIHRRVMEVRAERARLQGRGEGVATSSEPLGAEAASLYRAGAARANYLALDRADLTFAAKELCRRMSSPTTADLVQLRRLARCLVGAPRLLYSYPWQASAGIAVYVDTDFAGCSSTRKSTSGGIIFRGKHLLKTWSTTQKVVTLSSGEAELAGVVKGVA